MTPVNMVAACPRCAARYRIEAGRLRPEGVRVRCSRCSAVFRVTPPQRPGAPEPPPVADPRADPERLVLVADADVPRGKQLAGRLVDWGLSPMLVHDGVEAILTIQRLLPRVAVLDAALPKMAGFQICELMKRNESLRGIRVVLVEALHDEHRYRRQAGEDFGADAYLERPQLPEALRPILRGFGVASGAAAGSPATEPPPPAGAPPPVGAPTPAEAPTPVGAPTPVAAVPPPPAAAEAERLARIIVSDVVLYSPEKFEAGVRDGNVVEVLAAELEEGRALFEQRVDAEVRGQRDFLAEELLRVARARGMT